MSCIVAGRVVFQGVVDLCVHVGQCSENTKVIVVVVVFHFECSCVSRCTKLATCSSISLDQWMTLPSLFLYLAQHQRLQTWPGKTCCVISPLSHATYCASLSHYWDFLSGAKDYATCSQFNNGSNVLKISGGRTRTFFYSCNQSLIIQIMTGSAKGRLEF